MDLKYDTPVEVSKKQYDVCMRLHSGVCAGRTENGKYYIKVLLMKYVKEVERDLIKIK
jgi:hypothetical protein